MQAGLMAAMCHLHHPQQSFCVPTHLLVDDSRKRENKIEECRTIVGASMTIENTNKNDNMLTSLNVPRHITTEDDSIVTTTIDAQGRIATKAGDVKPTDTTMNKNEIALSPCNAASHMTRTSPCKVGVRTMRIIPIIPRA